MLEKPNVADEELTQTMRVAVSNEEVINFQQVSPPK